MVLAANSHIVFGSSRNRDSISLRQPESVKINKSWKTLTDTATIVLARNVEDFEKQKVKEVFAVGDPVEINLGYNGDYYQEFVGFISRVSADSPITIHCEDIMWKLKQTPVHISLQNTTLQNLLFTIVKDYEVDALEVSLGNVRYNNKTVAEVLEDLKRDYGLFSYMKGNTLVCGKIYADDTETENKVLHLERNVHANGNKLEYRSADDRIIKIKAVSTLANGKKIEVEVGDSGGEIKQLPFYGIEDTATLKKLAEEDLRKYKVDAYEGSVTTFGVPNIEHGQRVSIKSDLYPERDSIAYVETVSVSYGIGYKYKRNLTIGDRAV